MDPITHLDCEATVIEAIADGSRGPADCVVAVRLERGAWELDTVAADFGIAPVVGMALSADVREADRIDDDGLSNGRSVAIVGLREV